MTFEAVFDYLTNNVWCIHEPTLQRLTEIVLRRAQGVRLSEEEVARIVADSPHRRRAESAQMHVDQGVAVIPIHGVIARHARQVNGMSQPRGQSIERLRNDLAAALDDDQVKAILLDVNSPGGAAEGVLELAEEIRAARDVKPIAAHVDGMMASGALWLGTAASSVTATKGSRIGSIGAYAPLVDWSRAVENEGIRVHVVRAGEFKGVGVEGAPIERRDLAEIHREVEELAAMFREGVAENRGLELADVERVATGQMWSAQDAIGFGLIDSVGNYRDALRTLVGQADARRSKEGTPEDSGAAIMTKTTDTTPEIRTSAELERAYPALCSEIRDAAATAARADERARVKTIARVASPSQGALLAQLIDSDTAIDAAVEQLMSDPKREAHQLRQELQNAAPEPAPAAPNKAAETAEDGEEEDEEDDDEEEAQEGTTAKKTSVASDKVLRARFAKSRDRHYMDFEEWKELQAAEREGRVLGSAAFAGKED